LKIPRIGADYTPKQKIISFIISMGFSILVILAISYNLIYSDSSFEYNPFAFIDNPIVDKFFKKRLLKAKRPPVSQKTLLDLVLVKIDNESLGTPEFPQWPIPRKRYAELIERLEKAGAKTIGFDIVLAEESNPENDKILEEELAKVDNVFLPFYFYTSLQKVDREQVGTEGGDEVKFSKKLPYKPFYEALQKNTKEGDSRVGFVSIALPDVVRRVPIYQSSEDGSYYALSLLMASHFLGIPQDKLINHADKGYFMMGDTKIPLTQGLMRVNYMFPPSRADFLADREFNLGHFMMEFPISQVFKMTDEELKEAFDGRIVLVGATAEGAKDLKPTPFGVIPGVYSHANMIFSFLGKKFIKPATPLYNIIVVLIIGILMGLLIPRLSPWAGAVFTVLLCVGYYEYSYYRFVHSGVINYIASPILSAFFGYVVINIYHHVAEMKAKASISKMFREFAPLPSPLIEKYVEQYGGSAATGGTLAHVTILFADIRGYTDLSEKLSSQEVMSLLNEYHEAMGEVFKETGGVIFTYIGDAQLVVYGLEGISKINHAAVAIKAGLMMQERLDKLKAKWESENKSIFEVGVGMCTGELSIGVVGSSQLKQYTVIGDTVNVASRIQGMSRELAAPVLIHERTYLMAKDCIEADPLRPVKLKGKQELVNVYRAKKVLEIKPYKGDEIKDLNKEVEELHRQRKEAIAKLKAEREAKPASSREARRKATRRRRRKDEKKEKVEEKTVGDATLDPTLLEPLEEKSKGKVANIENEN